MLTVKEFKDLCGEFVFCDTCKVVGAIEPFTVNDQWVSNAKRSEFCDKQEVVSFAWRPLNTLPDNPKFKYEVDIGTHRWRPLLDQSAPKPVNSAAVKSGDDKLVFTQEMSSSKLLYGVGDRCGIKTVSNGKKIKSYSVWSGMLERCYSERSLANHPTYKDVSVCDEWLKFDNFKSWFDENYIEGFHLDKDILSGDKKIYSPEVCRFIPRELNNFLTGDRSDRGMLPQGVFLDKKTFRSGISIGGKILNLGNHKTPEDAYCVYVSAKESHAKNLAEKYHSNGSIGFDMYSALINWRMPKIDPDTRTPKQKAVDDIVKMLHSEGVVMFDPIMLHIMYEKGFIK